MEIENQIHKIKDQQRTYIWRWKHLIDFNFYQNDSTGGKPRKYHEIVLT